MGLQRGVFSVTSSREGVQSRFGRPRDLDHQPAASCDQHPSWCGPQHSSSAARPRRQRAKTPSTWPSPALYWEGAGKPQHSELSPAFPPLRRQHRSRPQGKRLSSNERPEVSGFVLFEANPRPGTPGSLTLTGNGEGSAGCYHLRSHPACVLRGLPQIGLECVAGPPAPPLN